MRTVEPINLGRLRRHPPTGQGVYKAVKVRYILAGRVYIRWTRPGFLGRSRIRAARRILARRRRR